MEGEALDVGYIAGYFFGYLSLATFNWNIIICHFLTSLLPDGVITCGKLIGRILNILIFSGIEFKNPGFTGVIGWSIRLRLLSF